MTDVEKVIKHFEDALNRIGPTDWWVFVRKDFIEDTIALLKEQQDLVAVVRCKDCKYSMHFYDRFNNDYVCKKNMDKSGKIPGQDLKGHGMDWYCADGKRKTD